MLAYIFLAYSILYFYILKWFSGTKTKLQNYGPWFDIQGAGVNSVVLSGLKNAKENFSSTKWSYQVLSSILMKYVSISIALVQYCSDITALT